MKIFSLRILLVLSLILGFGTAGSVGAAATSETTAPSNVKIEQWTGHSFTFLNLPSDTQSDGYDIFTED